MLYLITGTNREQARKRAYSYLNALKKKRPDSTYSRLTSSDTIDTNRLSSTQGLFDAKCIEFLDEVCLEKENLVALEQSLTQLDKSQNAFILFEETLPASLKKEATKNKIKIETFDLLSKTKNEFNIFSITEAFASKDKGKCWNLLCDAIAEGVAVEEILSVIEWQIRVLLLTMNSSTCQEAGLKPFVFNKAKKKIENFSAEELKYFLKEISKIRLQKITSGTDITMGLEYMFLSKL